MTRWLNVTHLLPSHQEKIHSRDVDINVVAENLEDFSDGGAGPEGEGGGGAVGQHHAAVFGGALPHADRVAIIRLMETERRKVLLTGVIATSFLFLLLFYLLSDLYNPPTRKRSGLTSKETTRMLWRTVGCVAMVIYPEKSYL